MSRALVSPGLSQQYGVVPTSKWRVYDNRESPVIGILVLPKLYNSIINRDGLMTTYFDAGFVASSAACRCQPVAELDAGQLHSNIDSKKTELTSYL